MTALSNLYVEKVISEHPLAVWMLNEEVDYLSSITETQRQFYNTAQWDITGGTATQETDIPQDTPFINSALTLISGNIPSGPTGQIVLNSDYAVPTTNFSEDLGNFAMSFYLRIDNQNTTSVTFGYQYYDPIIAQTVKITKTSPVSDSDFTTWMFFSNTFGFVPSIAVNPEFIIEINTESGGGAGDYEYLINGLTVGQWSEEFYRTSLGVNPIPLPSNIAYPFNAPAGLPECVIARPYGASTENAYYIAHEYRLYANNFGIPLVYGSSNVTKLFPHVHDNVAYANLIFPGYGFLNEKGRYNEYTAEMWIRVNTDANEARKLFGPLNSNDGLYIESGFLTLVIDNQYQSHYVGEWFRPMLIHIRYIQNNVSVLLNGEEVINIDVIQSEINLPSEFDQNGKSQDWLGFYAYEDVKPIDIDSLAIYSYSVPTEVAKRRWVWGQGVVAPETTNSLLNATTAFNDYSFTNYAVNYNYPDFASWRQAFFSNVETSSNFLQLPEYSLPFIGLQDFTTEEWYEDLKTSQSATADKYITFRPNGSWNNKDCYLYFSDFSVLNDNIETVYGVFQSDGTAVNQPLFKITNRLTNDFILVRVNGTSLIYTCNIDGQETIIATKTITANQKFTAGFNISELSLLPINGINKFFVDQSILNMFIGGDSGYTSPITAVNPNGGTIVFNSLNTFNVGDTVNITGINPPIYNISSPVSSKNSNQFQVSSSLGFASISSASGNGTLVTFIASANHGFTTGQIVSVSGINPGQYNITGPIAVTSPTQFTIANTATGAFVSPGIAKVQYVSGGVANIEPNTFTGRIYRIGLEAAYNNRKITSLYDADGIFNANLTTANTLMSHIANYTLRAFDKYSTFFLDISIAGYWEDYMPLSYFGKKVTDYSGKEYYDLDTIQINLDYPEPLEVSALESTSSWTYADLNARYADPVQLTYSILDNSFYSGWEDYEDMSEDSQKYYYYTTQNNAVRSYISFQKIADGANRNLVDFTYKTTPRLLGVINPETIIEVDDQGNPLPIEWENTAYEVVDGMVIYPPKTDQNNNSVDFNDLAIVYHLDFQTEGILHHPVTFRELQLASQVLERSSFTQMGTRFGVPVFPYSRSGIYYNYKGINPISTYKGSTPYLYLNRHSGWRLRGNFSPFVDRGISIPINQQLGLDVEVSAIQMWIRYADIVLPTQEVPIFSIDHKDGIYDFYIKSDESTQRGYIFARDRETEAIVTSLRYYVNGKLVDTPYIINEQWAVLGIAFTELLQFDSYTGRLNLNGPMTYNNISYYLATNLEQNQRVEVRSWGQVKDDSITGKVVNNNGTPTTIFGWQVWKYDTSIVPPNYLTWQEVAIADVIDVYSIDPSSIYDKYVGTTRIIFDDNVDGVMVDPEEFNLYSDITWSTTTATAV